MALQKDYTFKGITCNYWKIVEASEVYGNGSISIKLALYKDSAARAENLMNYIVILRYSMVGSDKTRDELYAYLKTLDDFEGAEDC